MVTLEKKPKGSEEKASWKLGKIIPDRRNSKYKGLEAGTVGIEAFMSQWGSQLGNWRGEMKSKMKDSGGSDPVILCVIVLVPLSIGKPLESFGRRSDVIWFCTKINVTTVLKVDRREDN